MLYLIKILFQKKCALDMGRDGECLLLIDPHCMPLLSRTYLKVREPNDWLLYARHSYRYLGHYQ